MAPSARKDRNFGKKKRRITNQHYPRQSYYRGKERKIFGTTYAKRSPTRLKRGRKPQRFYEPPYFRASSESSVMLEHAMEPSASTMKNRMDVMNAVSSSERPSSANSSVSTSFTEAASAVNSVNCTIALLKKKSLVQIINNYIRAGIEEGKRRAKQYIRRALSFGVKSGYLIPADQQGQVLHVSPALVNSKKPRDRDKEKARELRKRRLRARRGEDENDILDRKALRRGTSPILAKSKKLHDTGNDPVVPTKRRRKEPKTRKTNSTPREGHGKGSLDTALQEESTKSKRGRPIIRKKLTEKSGTSRNRRRNERKTRSPARKSIERNRSVSSLNENREERPSGDRDEEAAKEENRAALGFAKDRPKLPRIQHDVPRTVNEEKDSQDDEEEVNCGPERNDQEMWSSMTVDRDREAGDHI